MILASSLWTPFRMAHEVYVLNSQQITVDKHAAKIKVWDSLRSRHSKSDFLIYALAIGLSIAMGLYLKSRPAFQKLGRLIDRATYFAPDIIRVSLGAALLAGAHFQAVFGPELPVDSFSYHQFIEPFFYIAGIATILGLGTRLFGVLVSLFWVFALADKGWYMITYLNYLGEALALTMIPRQNISLDALLFKNRRQRYNYDKWALPVARILFGAALLYAAINVKFVTAKLSLDVVNQYHLTNYFHFDPLFVVLGAGLVEILMAVLFMLGLLQRLNSVAFMTFITLSLLYFKESVWPHDLLLGLAVGIFLHKPDSLALDSRLFKSKKKAK